MFSLECFVVENALHQDGLSGSYRNSSQWNDERNCCVACDFDRRCVLFSFVDAEVAPSNGVRCYLFDTDIVWENATRQDGYVTGFFTPQGAFDKNTGHDACQLSDASLLYSARVCPYTTVVSNMSMSPLPSTRTSTRSLCGRTSSAHYK